MNVMTVAWIIFKGHSHNRLLSSELRTLYTIVGLVLSKFYVGNIIEQHIWHINWQISEISEMTYNKLILNLKFALDINVSKSRLNVNFNSTLDNY